MYCIAQCHLLHSYFNCNVSFLFKNVVHLGTLLFYFLFAVIPLYSR